MKQTLKGFWFSFVIYFYLEIEFFGQQNYMHFKLIKEAIQGSLLIHQPEQPVVPEHFKINDLNLYNYEVTFLCL